MISPDLTATGTSKIPLWDTVKLCGARMNMLMMFGEDIGMCAPIANGCSYS